MKAKACLLFSVILLVILSVTPLQNSFFVSASSTFSPQYLVGTINGSFSNDSGEDYEVTICYPSVNAGASQPPNMTGAPYPAVVFAHGFACTKDDYSWIGDYFAAHGYVAILFSTPSQFNMFSAFPQSAEGISLSIDYLFSQSQEAGGLLEGVVDEERVGAMGHSMGAMASLRAAADDSRIKSVVSLAPGYFDFFSLSETYLEASELIKVPTQIIFGSTDTICPPSGGRKYYDLIPVEKEMLIVNGSFHDLGIWNVGNEPAWLGVIPGFDPVTQEHYLNTTTRYFISWFNYHLYNCSEYQTYIYGKEAWSDLENGVLSELQTSKEYTIVVVDEQSVPVQDVNVTLYDHNGTVLWTAFTDAFGATDFWLSLTPSNYTDTLFLETVKENVSLSHSIDDLYLNVQPKTAVIPEFPSWTLLPFILAATLATLLYRKKLKNRIKF